MKGLLRYLSPFAPDQSGASSVLYDLGGVIVICDAGGCTGNICGFDEPRWFLKKSAIFSAGLRDMDAILGRDERMVEKLKDVTDKLHAPFASVIGTPVPAVIATDFKAIRRMAEKKCGVPIITIECTGTRLYDVGATDTYLELFERFTEKYEDSEKAGDITGILGVNPLDTGLIDAGTRLKEILPGQIYTYESLEEIKNAGLVSKNLVISPSGLKAARYLNEKFAIPYEMAYPLIDHDYESKLLENIEVDLSEKKILIIHQQAAANEIRTRLKNKGAEDVTAATWFILDKEFAQEEDIQFSSEADYRRMVEENGYDLIIGDPLFLRALPGYRGEFIPINQFAVSGKLEELYSGRCSD